MTRMNFNIPKFLFFFILFISFVLRIVTLDSFETWHDEKISVREANALYNYPFQPNVFFTNEQIEKNDTFKNVIESTIQGDGGNGIVYILSLHYWGELFGNTDFSVRFFSVLCGLGVVILVYFLSLELFDNKNVALLTMFLTGIHSHLITYSQEARTYSLTLLFTVSATILLLKFVKDQTFKNKYLLFYAVLVALGFLSHYSSIYIFIAHFFLLIFIFKINLKNTLRLSAFLSITLLIFLLWFYSYGFDGLNIISGRNQNYIQLSLKDPTNTFYTKTSFYLILAGWFQNFLMFFGNTLVNLGVRIVVLLPLLIVPFWLIFSSLKRIGVNQHRHMIALLILSISSLLYATLLAITAGHIISFQQLYATFSVPYAIAMLSYCIVILTNSAKNNFPFVLKAGLGLQLMIMLVSVSLIYCGLDSNAKSGNKFEVLTDRIKTIHSNQTDEFIITYKDTLTAMEMNKYLNGDLADVKQVIDTTKTNPTLFLKFKSNQQRIVLEN